MDEHRQPGACMRAEIAEQPATWVRLVEEQADALQAASRLLSDRVRSIVLVGRGSSDHAAIYGQYLAESMLGIPAALATPSVSSLDGRDLFDPTTLVVAVSQSGSSPDLVATLESARRTGSPTLALTNDGASELARAADVHVDVCAGAEQSVAATKSYSGELVALHALLRLAAGDPYEEIRTATKDVALAAERLVPEAAAAARVVSTKLLDADRALIVGRGPSLATAKEAALKLIETCALPASGWSAADAKHGPLAQVGEGTPVFLLTGSSFGRDSVLGLVPDLRARGACLYVLGPCSDEAVDQTYTDLLPVVPDALVPMVEVIPLQLLALELSLLLGRDPDRPPGLSKVTRTL